MKIKNVGNNSIWIGGIKLNPGETAEVDDSLRPMLRNANKLIPGFRVVKVIVRRKKKSEEVPKPSDEARK